MLKKIEGYLNKKGRFIRFDKRVTAISQGHMTLEIPTSSPDHKPPVDAEESFDDWIDLGIDEGKTIGDPTGTGRNFTIPSVTVTVNGHETHNYSHTISTLPLSVLRTIDLSGAGLNIMQKNALRTLDYGPSTKVAILFKSNWWTTKLGIVGGQTLTDLPICSIVYPSHGVDSSTPSKVLVASYSWKGDANRLGVLATTKHRDALLELVLRNLAEAHSGLHPDVTYAYLREEFVDMHVKDWSREEYAMGKSAVQLAMMHRSFLRCIRFLWTWRLPRFVCVVHLSRGEQTPALCRRGNEHASLVSDIRQRPADRRTDST